MTRKDYIGIARALNYCVEEHKNVSCAVECITNELEDADPNFDRDHFLAAVRSEKVVTEAPKRVKNIYLG